MSEVVFLSNTNIQIAVGSSVGNGVKVSKLYSAPLPTGAVLNGVVMDQELVTETIKSAWQEYKIPKSEVMLIINSPHLRANRIDAPIQSEKKTTEFIARAMADTEYGRFTNPVTGWYMISKDAKSKTNKIIYETAENDFIKTYVNIFDKAGLKLKNIHNGVQIATEYFTKASACKTIIYMILDGNSLVTIFFADGKFFYDSTSRVFAEPGTPEFAREIYTSLSSIRQFISAQKLGVTLKDVLFAGISQAHVSTLANDILNLDSEIDISIVTPPSGTSISEGPSGFPFYVYPIAGLRKIDEKLLILKTSKQTKDKDSSLGAFKKLIIPFVGIILILGIIFGVLTVIKESKKAELKDLNKYINDPDVIAKVAEYDAMYGNMAEIGEIQGGADILAENIQSYPSPDSSINDQIFQAAVAHDVDVEINSYSANTGIYSITASSPIVDDINMFIADLMSLDAFYNIDYTGYNLAETDEEGSTWKINVVCTLAGVEPGSGDTASEAEGEVN